MSAEYTPPMSPDQCFDEMAVALGLPKGTGYLELLDKVKEQDWIIKRERCEHYELQENFDELIAEKKKLEKFALNIYNFCEIGEWDCIGEEYWEKDGTTGDLCDKLDTVIGQMKESNKKHQNRLTVLEEKISWRDDEMKLTEQVVKQQEEEIKNLKEEHLTEEKAIQYVYENTSKYDDWVKGSDVYEELQEKLQQEKDGREHDVQQFQSVLDEKGQLEAEVEELKEENKNLKDQVFHGTTKDEIKEIYRVTKKLQEENKKLKVEKEKEEMNVKILCKFLGGNSHEWFAVEGILREFYSEDFIKANKETWSQYGLFEDEEEEEIKCGDCEVCGCYHSEYDPCGTNCAKPEDQ
jgi:hypothetical protein